MKEACKLMNETGYTLIEILSVMVVISILASITAISINHSRKTINDQIAENQVYQVKSAIESCTSIYKNRTRSVGIIHEGDFGNCALCHHWDISPPVYRPHIQCENEIVTYVLPEGISANISVSPSEITELCVSHENGSNTFCLDSSNSDRIIAVSGRITL